MGVGKTNKLPEIYLLKFLSEMLLCPMQFDLLQTWRGNNAQLTGRVFHISEDVPGGRTSEEPPGPGG